MKIIYDDLWLCPDCMIATVNEDYSGMEDDRADEVQAALADTQTEGWLASNWDSETGEGIHEFSWSRCDCCGSPLGGSRYRFALLGED